MADNEVVAGSRAEKNLDDAIAHTAGEISRTDGKASFLMTLDGVLIAAVAALGKDIHGAALVAAVIGVVSLVAAAVLGLVVVHPRLRAPGGNHDRASFIYWASASPEDIISGMREDRRIARVQVLSRIALRKMRYLQCSGAASLCAVIAIAIAAVSR
ncbi:Pycsar system effector family protein [Streptomyces sp. DW26H14]|uniref:Pycsar system effector family protein n=1 Tax=Streptomyces sp. DW26H14 TaxID=3435395 RepID=UPI00403DC5EE